MCVCGVCMYMYYNLYIYEHMLVITINEKRGMNLKEKNERCLGGLGKREEKGKCCNYNLK